MDDRDTRKRLLEGATELMTARSYQAVGVQAICDRAGVRKGSFYHFFSSKQALTLAAIDALWQWFRDRVLEPALAADRPPLERIERLFESIAEVQAARRSPEGGVAGCPFGNLALEMSTQDEAIRARLETVFAETEARLAATLAEARDTGALPGLDPAAAARALFAYIEGAVMLAKIHDDPTLIRELGRTARFALLGREGSPEAPAA